MTKAGLTMLMITLMYLMFYHHPKTINRERITHVPSKTFWSYKFTTTHYCECFQLRVCCQLLTCVCVHGHCDSSEVYQGGWLEGDWTQHCGNTPLPLATLPQPLPSMEQINIIPPCRTIVDASKNASNIKQWEGLPMMFDLEFVLKCLHWDCMTLCVGHNHMHDTMHFVKMGSWLHTQTQEIIKLVGFQLMSQSFHVIALLTSYSYLNKQSC